MYDAAPAANTESSLHVKPAQCRLLSMRTSPCNAMKFIDKKPLQIQKGSLHPAAVYNNAFISPPKKGNAMTAAVSPSAKAAILSEALPYIRRFAGCTLVVKYGGNAMTEPQLKEGFAKDIVLLKLVGINPVIVHGGGPQINGMLEKIGKKGEFIGGLRVTDAETMEVVQQVLAGKVNKNLVAHLGGRGIGLCGIDGGLLHCEALDPALGAVGKISRVQPNIIHLLLGAGMIPVVASIGTDAAGNSYNINADTAAAAIATAIGACKLVNMTDIAGLLRYINDEDSLIRDISIDEAEALINQGIISGGMLPKIACCIDAVRQGVPEVAIIDGRRPHSVLQELFSDRGNGTLFHQ